ncbi:MAG: UDP-N-acetylmuramoyl-L-alanine--D-glutamate ligase [Candidatus Dadabacteria bacterium]|nr:MAG: UDP-N-acetylmuramoyl-L-alanine--D-glutamate ligase [Candidatus Dadabacteria bacterium]
MCSRDYIVKRLEKTFKISLKKDVLLLGLGKSNTDLAIFFQKAGINFSILELKKEEEVSLKANPKILELINRNANIQFSATEDQLKNALLQSSLVVLSPSISPLSTWGKWVKESKLPTTTELEVAAVLTKTPLITVTGTVGKSTTANLISQILSQEKKVFLGGNIGIPLINHISAELYENKRYDYGVAEASSYQLYWSQNFLANMCLFLNFFSHHIDWHGSVFDYYIAKASLFFRQKKNTIFILDGDDKSTVSLGHNLSGRVFYFGNEPDNRDYVRKSCWFLSNKRNSVVFDAGKASEEFSLDDCALTGAHNKYNISAAVLATKLCKASSASIRKALKKVKPLPFRQELFTLGDITVINDSKSTTLVGTISALNGAVSLGFTWLIVGGILEGEFEDTFIQTVNFFKDKLVGVVFYGEKSEKLFKEFKMRDLLPSYKVNKMEDAVKLLSSKVKKGQVILFSPGGSSFDEDKNFEERGKRFNQLLKQYL